MLSERGGCVIRACQPDVKGGGVKWVCDYALEGRKGKTRRVWLYFLFPSCLFSVFVTFLFMLFASTERRFRNETRKEKRMSGRTVSIEKEKGRRNKEKTIGR